MILSIGQPNNSIFSLAMNSEVYICILKWYFSITIVLKFRIFLLLKTFMTHNDAYMKNNKYAPCFENWYDSK